MVSPVLVHWMGFQSTLESRIMGGVGIIGGLDLAIIINKREGRGAFGIIRGVDGVEKIV